MDWSLAPVRLGVRGLHFWTGTLHCRMLQRLSRRDAHRRAQARYARRARAGVGVYRVPLTHYEIGKLIALGYLREGGESDRDQVGEAVAAAIRSIRSD